MSKKIIIFFLLFLVIPVLSEAQLDFDQEIIVIPEVHDIEPYQWNTAKKLWRYKTSIKYNKKAVAGNDIEFNLTVRHKKEESLTDMHVFITDKGLNTFRHIRPILDQGNYKFIYNPPWNGKYRFEVIFRASGKWIKRSKNIKFKGGNKDIFPDRSLTDAGYNVKIKAIPEEMYANHVGTFIYEISYQGNPIQGIEKIDGVDMQIAVWSNSRRDFIYTTPKQNFGGSEVAVNIVFPNSMEYTIFAEFKHSGIIRRVKYDVNIY